MEISGAINTQILIKRDKFNDIAKQIENAKGKINEIKNYWNSAHTKYKDLNLYDEHKKTLEDIILDIDDQIGDIKNWEEEEYHLITTGSFLVCRCGGMITIRDSGQRFDGVADTLQASILGMLAQFKESSMKKMEDYSPSHKNEADDVWVSHNAVVEGLGYFENMLRGNGGETEQKNVCIYIELICHSYNDEMKKAMKSFLSLLSIKNAVLACGLAVYEIATMEDNPEGMVDGILAEADVLESLKEDGEGILTRLGAGRIAKMASIYGVVTNIINLFYVSYATWIENIKITVFTDTHAHVSKRTLNIIGELEAGEDIKFFSQLDYSTDQKGDGLKWKEEPGVYMRRWAHKGDNMNNEGVEVDGTEIIESGVVYQE